MVLSLTRTPALSAARHIAETLRTANAKAYLAGGCVRDLLLGLNPKDFDVATSATPDQITALFPRTQAVGAHFGVILVLQEIENESIATEVATFRHDGAYLDGRRPEAVRFSSDPREDVLRRDFTINGMLLDPAGFTDEGDRAHIGTEAVLDYVGGQPDLAARILRTIGSPNQRFEEDKLRMLRGIRFAARLNLTLEPETFTAIQQHAPELTQVSNERVRDELTRMLTEGHASRAFELLHATGLLQIILPEVETMRGVEQPPQYHPEGDVWIHTLMLLDHLPTGASPTLAWGMLLHDIGKPATYQPPNPQRPGDRIRFNGHVEAGVRIAEVILNRLRFSNDDCAQILALIRHHMQFGDIKSMKTSTLKRFLRIPRFDEHLALHRADCLSSHGDLRLYDFALEASQRQEPEQLRPVLLVTGRDLIAAGYRPGPRFKAMLEAAEDAQLEGELTSREQGLARIAALFGAP